MYFVACGIVDNMICQVQTLADRKSSFQKDVGFQNSNALWFERKINDATPSLDQMNFFFLIFFLYIFLNFIDWLKAQVYIETNTDAKKRIRVTIESD